MEGVAACGQALVVTEPVRAAPVDSKRRVEWPAGEPYRRAEQGADWCPGLATSQGWSASPLNAATGDWKVRPPSPVRQTRTPTFAVYQTLKNSPNHHDLFLAAAGFNAAYGNRAAPLNQVLTAFGLSQLPVLDRVCDVASAIDRYPLSKLVKADPFTVPEWRTLKAANDPGTFTAPSPLPLAWAGLVRRPGG